MTKLHPSIVQQAQFLAAQHPNDLVTVINVRGEFQYVSPSSVAILGYTPDDAMGRPFPEFVHPDDVPALYLASQQALLGEKSSEVGLRVRLKDGSELPMRGYAIKLLDPLTGDPYLVSLGYVVR